MTLTYFPPLGTSATNPVNIAISSFVGNVGDMFGRLRVSEPFTVFDSQSRFASSIQYNQVTATGGTASFVTNKSATALTVTSTSGSTVLSQTNKVFPYQPGKSLLSMQTFSMNAAIQNLTQRVGYYGAQNGVYLEVANTQVSFVIRTYTSGSVDNSRYVTQANWNVDKFDGTGPSGVTLDLTKTQILFIALEWLGVGSVNVGFVVNGAFRTAHIFQNANIQTAVYMQTAILPLRYEIFTTGTTTGSATLQQICSTVIVEGGYQQISQPYTARPTNSVTVGTSFTPLISIRINSSYYGAMVLLESTNFLPIGSGQYEVVVIKNGTLTGATWAGGTISSGQVDTDLAATAVTVPSTDSILQTAYATATSQAKTNNSTPFGYNFALQLGYVASLSGNGFASSDVVTLAARTLSGTNACLGSITFYNLTV